MTNQQGAPEALRLAELLELAPEDGVEPQTTEDAAAELRRQHTRIAELEARIKTMAEEHADELMVAHMDGRMRAEQPAGAQQPGTAYAELPSYEHQRAIMEAERNASLDEYSRIVPLTSTESMIYERAFTNGWNRHASHGQAPAQAASQDFTRTHHRLMGDAMKSRLENGSHEAMMDSYAQAAPAAVAGARDILEKIDTLIASINEAHISKDAEWKRGCFAAVDSVYEQIKVMLAAAPTTQPAPQQEAQEPVDSMGMPLSCGKPLCAPGNHHPLCKLAAPPPSPQPSPASQGDALDAALYRWLCDEASKPTPSITVGIWGEGGNEHAGRIGKSSSDVDAAIRAARSAQEGKSHG